MRLSTALILTGAGTALLYGLFLYLNPSAGYQNLLPDFSGGGTDYSGAGTDTQTGDIVQQQPSGSPVGVTSGSSNLITFCTAIRDYEGKPGNINYRNNNPGNIRSAPGYGTSGGYAVFPDYQTGWNYLLDYVIRHAETNPSWSFVDFFTMYAPSADSNNPTAYANFVAARCGVSPSTSVFSFIGGGGAVA